ncbi:MAG: hypothetical protein B7Z02_12020 [Rhodobacterales bacterium 32-67-9]|nr:MAG: hypothetical protein B7Z02_12020 [Rhodobacterales bacterium 32-67-9]
MRSPPTTFPDCISASKLAQTVPDVFVGDVGVVGTVVVVVGDVVVVVVGEVVVVGDVVVVVVDVPSVVVPLVVPDSVPVVDPVGDSATVVVSVVVPPVPEVSVLDDPVLDVPIPEVSVVPPDVPVPSVTVVSPVAVSPLSLVLPGALTHFPARSPTLVFLSVFRSTEALTFLELLSSSKVVWVVSPDCNVTIANGVPVTGPGVTALT